MKLIAMIPLSDVVSLPECEPCFTFVMSQGYLKIYKSVR